MCKSASLLISSPDQLAGDATFDHHEHPVTKAGQLLYFRRDDDHAGALGGKAAHNGVNIAACAHVHAARWLVQDDHLDRLGQPLPDDDLLLVAAREVAHRGVHRTRLDLQLLHDLLGTGIGTAQG